MHDICCVFYLVSGFLQELTQQIKTYQARINELSEKSHNLAERSADLGPLCARKLYHSGERETRVTDLISALNAPMEPYISPLSSPNSPRQSAKYLYENPLKLYKGEEIGPITSQIVEPSYESPRQHSEASYSAQDLNRHTSRPHEISLPKIDKVRPSVVISPPSSGKIKPAVVLSPPSMDRMNPSVQMMTSISSPNVGKIGHEHEPSNHKPPPFSQRLEKDLSHTDSGVNFSPRSSARSLESKREPLSVLSASNSVDTELSTETPTKPAIVSKRPYMTEQEDEKTLGRSPKSLRSSADRGSNVSLDVASVLSGSTDDPRSSVSHWLDTDGAETASLSSHPLSGDYKYQRKKTNTNDASDKENSKFDDSEREVDEEMVAFHRRKEEALKPFKPKSKYTEENFEHHKVSDHNNENQIIGQDFLDGFKPSEGSKADTTDYSMKIKSERSSSLKGPMKGDHDSFQAFSLPSSFEKQVPHTHSKHSYTPRSPSPLTLDRSSLSRSAEAEKDLSRSDLTTDGLHRHSRSVSPRTIALEDEDSPAPEHKVQRLIMHKKTKDGDSLSKSLTSAQIRSISPSRKHDSHLRPNNVGFNSVCGT